MQSDLARFDFEQAFRLGDLATIQSYVSRPDIRADLTRAEQQLLHEQSRLPPLQIGGQDAWYSVLENWSVTYLQVLAARRGHIHIIEWLFSREVAAIIPATLVLLFSATSQFDRHSKYGSRACPDATLVTEVLLSSFVFLEVQADEQRQDALDEIASFSASRDVVRLAIAHDARMSKAMSGLASRPSDTECIVDMIAAEGAFVTGARVLDLAAGSGNAKAAARWLALGTDWGNDNGRPLITAVDLEIVELLLDEGFADVDARDDDGQTALMHSAMFDSETNDVGFDHDIVTWKLLECQADVRLTDSRGNTAMDWANTCFYLNTVCPVIGSVDPTIGFYQEQDDEDDDVDNDYVDEDARA